MMVLRLRWKYVALGHCRRRKRNAFRFQTLLIFLLVFLKLLENQAAVHDLSI
jgi:hypothetical protein